MSYVIVEPSEIYFCIYCMNPEAALWMKEKINSFNDESDELDLLVKSVSIRPPTMTDASLIADFELLINAPLLENSNKAIEMIKIKLREFAKELGLAIEF